MAKEMLLSVLVNVLGDFIEGITEENLKVGVWSGKIELRNLQLHRAGIEKLKLPVTVINGFVDSISVNVPWASLASKPVKIFIEGVNLLMGPLDMSSLDPAEAHERNVAADKAKLLNAEQAIELVAQITEQNDPKATSLLQNLATQILDNLEIRISNIHIRYEDSTTFPGTTFAYGITLHSFIVTTTNKNWQETFHKATEGVSLVHKLGTIENLVVYWNTHSDELSHLEFGAWKDKMNSLIYSRDRAEELEHMNYIVGPPNALIIKLIHNGAPGAVPRVAASVESMDMIINIDKLQYHQIMQTLDAHNTMETRQRLVAHRPSRSARVNPRAWWQYGVILLTQNERLFTDKMALCRLCSRHRRRYIELCTKRKILNSALVCEPLSQEEEAELDRIERTLPVESLLLFRQIAIKEAIVRNQRTKKEAADAAAAAKSKSWFSGWGGGNTSKKVEHGDVSLDDLQKDLEKAMHSHLVDMGAFTVDFNFVSSTLLSVTTSERPIAQMRMGLSAMCTLRGEGMQAEVHMTNLLVTDEFTPSPVVQNLIAVCSSSSSSPSQRSPFTVTFRNTSGKIQVGVKALPLQVTMNKFCIQQLLSVVQVDPANSMVSEMRALHNAYIMATAAYHPANTSAPGNDESSAWYALATAQLPQQSALDDNSRRAAASIEVVFEADAPKIVIPEDSCSDMGFLLLDTGHLMIRGEMGPAGMAWNVKLSSINAALPRCAEELYTFSENCNYLIRPFEVEVDVQNIDKTAADMTVTINVNPSIQGELSADKLSRLMHIIDIVPSTFTKLPSESPCGTAAVVMSQDSVSWPTTTTLTLIDTREVDPFQRSIVVRANIPSISLQLHYGSDDKERALLSIDMLSADITMRPYDMQILFDLKSLSIQDFTRDESQMNLARTPLEGQESLVHIAYTKLNHIKSPLYKEFGTEVIVEFNKLFLNSDASTLLHLRPFYEVILGKRLANYPPEPVVQVQALSRAVVAAATPVLEYVPSGMHVTVTLRTISLELLKADMEEYCSSTANKVLDSVVCVDISGLTSEVTMAELMVVTVNIRSLKIIDTRYLSSDYHFKTILGPAALLQGTEDETDQENLSDMERASSIDIMNSQQSDSTTDILILKYSEDGEHDSTLNIDVGAVTSFLSLDTCLDLVNIAVINAMAVVQLTATVDCVSIDTRALPDAQLTATASASSNTQVAFNSGDDRSKSMSIHISMPGARMIMLEDPTERKSRAICLRLGLNLHYITVTNGDESQKSVDEALHCAVTDVEVYVIVDMERNRPHQIMDPMSLLFNHKKTVEKGIALTTHVSVGIDGLHTRFSLADIMLVQAILLRRTVVDSALNSDASAELTVASSNGPPQVQHLTLYQIKLNVGSISAIVINDSDGKNIPIVRLNVEDTIFEADGFLRDMQGSGSMVLKMDAYNHVVTEWEPLVDPWLPSLTVNSDSTDLNLKVVSNDRFQISITSTFLNSISQTLSLWELMHEHRGEERGAVPSLTFANDLGVPIEITSTTTGESIFFLDCDYEGAIFLNHRSTGDITSEVPNRVSEIVSRLPTAVDIHFHSPEMTDRRPLVAIPLTSVSRQKYGIESRAESSMNRVPAETIQEVIYQYKRYMPLNGWGDPCLLGDPPEWSNASGSKEITKSSVHLPSEAWEWVGDWTVDKSGAKQSHVDKNGWEYAATFSDFTSTNKRRGEAQTMDYARRRRWVRNRVPVSNSDDPSLRQMALFWDVLVLDDGSQVITLRSCLQIQNSLPYAVMLQLSSNSWKEMVNLGPLLPDGVLSVPLLFASAEYVRFKGADVPTDWTPPLACGIRSLDYEIQAEIACTGEIDGRMLHIRPVIKQVQKALHIMLCPHIIVTNAVPCRLGYRFFISGTTKKDPKQRLLVDEGFLEPGAKCSLSHVKVTHITHVALNIGGFGWSEVSNSIFHKGTNSSRVNLPFFGSDGKIVLILRLRVNEYINKPFEIIIFSKDALINYTGLDISVDCLVEKGRSNRIRRSSGGTYDLALAGSSGAVDAAREEQTIQTPVEIESFVARSRRRYTITRASMGSTVHTDRHHRFTFLPPVLNGQTFISTPCNDRDLRLDGSNMLQFTLTEPSLVLLLLDKRVSVLPAWVKVKEYRATLLHATSCGVHEGIMAEVHYAVYGKNYRAGERIALGANHSADARDMYTVFILSSKESPHNKFLLEQLLYSCSTQETLAQRSWCCGDNGIVLFNSENAKIDICMNAGRARTSNELNMKILPTEKGPFEIVDRQANVAWQLAYSVVPMPGIFARTKILSIMPRYCIANCTDQALQIKQKASNSVICVDPFTSKGWHKSNATGSTEVRFRSAATLWSLGTLDINELGTTEVLLPYAPSDGEEHFSHIVVNVEVKMASVEEHCAVSIIFWRSDPHLGSPLSIKNESSMPLYARQADVAYTNKSARQFQMTVPPGAWLPFGWAEPFGTNLVQISLGDVLDQPSTKTKTLPFMASKKKVGLPFSGCNVGRAVVTVETRIGGALLCVKDAISNETFDVNRQSSLTSEDDMSRASTVGDDLTNIPLSVWISLKLAFVGISIIADKPERREFLSLYAENADLMYGNVRATNMQSVELNVNDLQIDNYCETAVYPVLLRRVRQKGAKKESQDALPFFQFALIRETTAGTPPAVQFRYITMRLIEFALEVDSSTIELLLTDVLSEYSVTSPAEALARTKPRDWIAEYNGQLLSPMHRVQLVDIFRSHMEAKASKIYFENIIIHPMKVALTFLPTKSPVRDEGKTNSIGTAVIDILTSMAAVELMEIRFNSFIVKDAIESMGTLQTRVTSKLKQELIRQLAQIAGSLTVLGSPAGLVRNVGGGVQDFFYEPYQGLVQSPHDFLIGIKKGTSSLLAGVLGGVLNSTVGIVGTASSGLAYLTGDSEYVQQRALERHRIKEKARHQGVAGGLRQGGKDVLSGFASGVTGIFTQPAEQIKKDGAIGIFAGIGKGVAGVAVKPILGITDGLSTIVSSITSEVNDDAFSSQKRPSRTFSRQSTNPSVLVLSPLDLAGAGAQAYVAKQATKHGFKDRYVANYALTRTSHLILSEKHVYLLLDGSKDWKCSWSDISQLTLQGSTIELYLYEDTSSQRPVRIRCSGESAARKCYRVFSQNAHRLSNPRGVRDPEVLQRESTNVAASSDMAASSGGYAFGLANYNDIKHKNLSEKEIYKSMKSSLLNISSTSDNEIWCEIDNIVWSNLFQWSSNHSGFTASRSLALILINTSSRAVQLTGFELKRGKSVAIFGTPLYERGGKVIKPRGCVVVFVCAQPPNLYDSGHILLNMESNAFELTVATRANKTTCKGKDIFECAFLEKSSTEWWSKYTVKLS